MAEDNVTGSFNDEAQEKIREYLAKGGHSFDNVPERPNVIKMGETPHAFSLADTVYEKLPHYDKYEGSAWEDLASTVVNAGVIRTGEGLGMMIPSVAKQFGAGDWANSWIDSVIDWGDRNELYVSKMGQKSFFDTYDARSLAAGFGQGLGSMIPMAAAAAVGSVTGGAGALGFAASTVNMFPTIVEEGLNNGLDHQEATALSMAISPIVGLLEKAGFDAAVKAGMKGVTAGTNRKMIDNAIKSAAKNKKFGKDEFGKFSVKESIMDIMGNYDKELGKAGILKGLVGKDLREFAKAKAKTMGAGALEGSAAEFGTEFTQSMVETLGKQIYDNMFAGKETSVGDGKFGADVVSKEAFHQALEEGFYGGLVGGSFGMIGNMSPSLRRESITGALDAAKKNGKLSEEIARMHEVVSQLPSDSKEEVANINELKKIIDTAGAMVQTDLSQVDNSNARGQIYRLSHLQTSIEADLDNKIEGTLPSGLKSIQDAKNQEMKQRSAEIKRAVQDIHNGNEVVDLNEYAIWSTPDEATKYSEDKIKKAEEKAQKAEAEAKAEEAKKTGDEDVKVDAEPEVKEGKKKGRMKRFFKKVGDATGKLYDRVTGKEVEEVEVVDEDVELKTSDASKIAKSVGADVEMNVDGTFEQPTGTASDPVQAAVQVQEAVDKLTEAGFKPSKRVVSAPTKKAPVEVKEVTPAVKPVTIDSARALGYGKGKSDAEVIKHAVNSVNKRRDKDNELDIRTNEKLDPVKMKAAFETLSEEELKSVSKKSESAAKGRESIPAEEVAEAARHRKIAEKEQELEALRERPEETSPEEIVSAALPKISVESASKETGLKVGVGKDIHSSLVSKEGGISVSEAAEKIYAEQFATAEGESAVSEQQVKDMIIDLLSSGTKRAYLKDIGADTADQIKALESEIADLKGQLEEREAPPTKDVKEAVTDALNSDLYKDILGSVKTKARKARIGYGQKVSTDPDKFLRNLEMMAELYPGISVEVFETLMDEDGDVVMGLASDEGIQINENEATQDTIFHEYAHKIAPMIKLGKKNLYKEGLKLIEDTQYYKDAKEAYPKGDENTWKDEALTNLIAEKSEAAMEERLGSSFGRIKAWLKRAWSYVKTALGMASAQEVADVIAAKMVLRNSPSNTSGVQITGKKYSKQSIGENSLMHMRRMRNAMIISKIVMNTERISYANKSNPDFAKALYKKIYTDIHAAEHGGKKAGAERIIKKHKNTFDLFRNMMSSVAFEAREEMRATVEHLPEEILSEMEDYDVEMMVEEMWQGSSLQESGRIDKNVRAILDEFVDERGNNLDPNMIYGIVTRAARGAQTKKEFVVNLRKIAYAGRITNTSAHAAQLHDLLEELPDSLANPVIEQMRNLVTVDYIKLTTDSRAQRSRMERSNEPRTRSSVIGTFKRMFYAKRIQAANNERLGSMRMSSFKILHKALGNIEALMDSGVEVNSNDILKTLSTIESSLKELTGIPFNADWFSDHRNRETIMRDLGDITSKAKLKEARSRINETRLKGIKSFLDFADVIAGDFNVSDQMLQEKFDQAGNHLASKEAAAMLKPVSENIIRYSLRDSGMFKNSKNNLQRAYRIGGFIHRAFNQFSDKSWLKAFEKNPMFHASGNRSVREVYKKHFRRRLREGKGVVAHTDGIVNRDAGISAQMPHMHLDDDFVYKMGIFMGTAQWNPRKKRLDAADTYYQAVGVSGSREYQAMVEVPVITDTVLLKDVIKKNYRNSKYAHLLNDFIPSLDAVEADIEARQEKANALPDAVKKQIFGTTNENVINSFVEGATLNDVVHRFHLTGMLLGDISKITDSKEIVKRLAGVTSPNSKVDMGQEVEMYVVDDIVENGEDITDAHSFVNDFIIDKFQEAGGSLMDIGNSLKPLVNYVTGGGQWNYVKTSSIGFKGRSDGKGNYPSVDAQDAVKGKIARFINDKSRSGKPVMIVFKSALKSPLPEGAVVYGSIDELIDSEGKPSHSLHRDSFGMQFNIHEKVTDKKESVLSTQLMRLFPLDHDQAVELENLLSKITNFQLQEAEKYLGDKKRVIKDALRMSKHGGDGFGNTLIQILADNPEILEGGKLDHVNLSHKLQSYISSVLTKTVRYTLKGSKLKQSISYDMSESGKNADGERTGRLKWMELKDGEIQPGEIKVPRGSGVLGEKVIVSRIPNSEHNTNFIATIVGFTGEGNEIEMPHEWIKVSDSDNDGDSVFILREDKSPKGELAKMKQDVFKFLYNGMKDGKRWERYNKTLKTKELETIIDETTEATGYDVTTDPYGTTSGMEQVRAKLSQSSRLIGVFAVASKIIDVLTQSDVNVRTPKKRIKGKYEHERAVLAEGALTILGKQLGSDFTSSQKEAIAQLLQIALDDTNKLKMSETGITMDNAGVATLILGLGGDARQMMMFMKSKPIAALTKAIAEERKQTRTEKKAKFIDEIIDESIAKAISENNYGDLETLKEYKRLHLVAKKIQNATPLVQSDKGVAKNGMKLQSFNSAAAKITEEADSLAEAKEIYDDMLDWGTFNQRPLVKLHKKIHDVLGKVYADYFSASSMDLDSNKALTDTLNSIDFEGAGAYSKEAINHVNKTVTMVAAQNMIPAEQRPNSREESRKFIRTVAAQMNNVDKTHPAAAWLNLVYSNVFGGEDGMKLTPVFRGEFPEFTGVNNPEVDRDFVNQSFRLLPKVFRDALTKYVVYETGFAGGFDSIVNLMPDEVILEYFKQAGKIKINEEFNDHLATSAIDKVKRLPEAKRKGMNIENSLGGDVIRFEKVSMLSKYFTAFKAEPTDKDPSAGTEYLYKLNDSRESAELVSEMPKGVAETKKRTSGIESTPILVPGESSDLGVGLSNTPMPEGQTQEYNQVTRLAEELGVIGDRLDADLSEDPDVSEQIFEKNPVAVKGLKRTLRRLSRKFGVKYKIVNDPDADYAGAYDWNTGTVIINEAKVQADTPFHEFAHPFIAAVKKENRAAYRSLLKELQSSKEGKEAIAWVKDNYQGLTESQQLEEALVNVLGKMAAGQVQSRSLLSKLKALLRRIAESIKSLVGVKPSLVPSQLSATTSLLDMAGYISSEARIGLDLRNDETSKSKLENMKSSLKEKLGAAYDVVNLKSVLNDHELTTLGIMKGMGFMPNMGLLIKDAGSTYDSDNVLGFRVPQGMEEEYMKKIRKTYPQAKFVESVPSISNNYRKRQILLEPDRVVNISVPSSDTAGSVDEASLHNISFSVVDHGSVGKDKNPRNEYIHGGSNLKGAKSERYSVEAGKSKLMNMLDQEFREELKGGVAPTMDSAINAMDRVINTLRSSLESSSLIAESGLAGYVKLNIDNHLKGVIATNLAPDILIERLGLTPDQQVALNPKDQVKMDNLIRAAEIVGHKTATKDYFLSMDGEGRLHLTPREEMTRALINDINEQSAARARYADKHPVFGKIYRALTRAFSGKIKKYWFGTMTTKTFANIVAGKKNGLFRSLVYDDLNKGEERSIVYTEEMEKLLDKSRLTEDQKNLSRTIRVHGQSLNISTEQAIALYMTLKRESALTSRYVYDKDKFGTSAPHIPVSFGKTDAKIENKAPIGVDYMMSKGDADAFMESFEGSEFITQAEALREMFDKSKEYINPVMKQHIGVGIQEEENYFPLSLGRLIEGSKVLSFKKIEDLRFIKSISEDAKGTIQIKDAYTVADYYIRETAHYYAYAQPIMNLRKLQQSLNYSKDGFNTAENSTHEQINTYIQDLLDNVQDYSLKSGIVDEEYMRLIQKLVNNFQLSVLGFNPSVMFKQVVSVLPASVEFGNGEVWKNSKYRAVGLHVTGMWKKWRLDLTDPVISEMMDYSPMMRQRFQGFIDRETGEYMASQMGKKGDMIEVFGKSYDKSRPMEGIKIMDAAAMAMIFARVKDEMKEKHNMQDIHENDAAFRKLVKERFEQIVNDTQPTYSVVNRTQLARSKNQFLRIFTMFGSQRSKNANMFIDTVANYMADPTEANRIKLKSVLVVVGFSSSLTLALMDKMKFFLYGNNDDEDVVDFFKSTMGMTIGTSLGNFYGGTQIYSGVFADTPWDPVSHPVIDLMNESLGVFKHVGKGEFGKALDKGVITAAKARGLPIFPYATARRVVKSLAE